MDGPRRALLIVNAGARGARTGLGEAVAARLEALGWDAPLARTSSAAEAAARIAGLVPGAVEVVAVAGGDGTARVAAGALGPTGPPLAVIPCGSANIAALDLGLPTAPDAIAAMIAAGATAPVSLGRANGAPFLVVAGVGLPGLAAGLVSGTVKRAGGARPAYGLAILAATALAPKTRLTIDLDGRTIEAAWALAGNARLSPGSLRAYGGSGLRLAFGRDDGLAGRARLIAALAAGRLGEAGVEIRAFSRATISSDRPVACMIDGEAFGRTPLTLESAGAVRVIVPA